MKQIYIHGQYPGGNDRLKETLVTLGYDRAVSENDCKDSRGKILEIVNSQAFYTNRVVEDEFEWQLADQLGLNIITRTKFETMLIEKLLEIMKTP